MKTVFSLNKNWQIISANEIDSPEFHASGIPTENALVGDLPAFTHMYIEDHVGISWYQKIFDAERMAENGERAILTFEYADFRAEVSMNGNVLGEHIGPEESFSFDVTDILVKENNRITVRISKPYEKDVDGYTFAEIPTRNQLKAGITPGSCYNESGLPGTVTLSFLPCVRIDDLFVYANPDNGDVEYTLTVRNDNSEAVNALVNLNVRLLQNGEPEDTCGIDVRLEPGDNTVKAKLNIPDFRWWSTEEPNLYEAEASVNSCGVVHRKSKRTGFRTFRVRDDGYFELNGKRIFLKCSHTGNSMLESTHHLARDKELLRKDFLMAKATGFNAIRFISGAALPMQLDLCDEIGLMVYEEPVAGWLTFNGPHASECFINELRAIIKRDRSHPCITIWGLLNETFCKEPSNNLYEAARDALPMVRELDPTRLVLFSSGRWDAQSDIGSLANPFVSEWQTLWSGEGFGDSGDRSGEKGIGGDYMGDVHFYPNPIPMCKEDIAFMRGLGKKHDRPVFISEFGIGSLLDTESLVKRFEQKDYSFAAPDVKMVKRMNDTFEFELKKYGFDKLYPFVSEIMYSSMLNHAAYRIQLFDILRANKNINGMSITGLLDHSICGEGLWTNFREFKPMIADVLQDGFSTLRWCIILPRTAVFRGESIDAEVFLANEDVLKPDKKYTVRCGLMGDRKTYSTDTFDLVFDEETVSSFAVHVSDSSFRTDDLADGRYRVKFDLLNGADPTGSFRYVGVFEHVKSKTGRDVFVTGLTDTERSLLASLGFAIKDAACENKTGDIVLAGRIDDSNADLIRTVLENGASVVAARAYESEDKALSLIPEGKRPSCSRDIDWLYRKETLLSPESDYFEGVPTGMCDSVLWSGVMTNVVFDAPNGSAPDRTDAVSMAVGYPGERGYTGGFKLGTYKIGKGMLIVNGFNLLSSADKAPMAERILVNILDRT